jgi:hypothetical protein
MTDHFAPPEDTEPVRHRPSLCKAKGPEGERCYLYVDHEAEYHWDGKVRWAKANYLPAEVRERHR